MSTGFALGGAGQTRAENDTGCPYTAGLTDDVTVVTVVTVDSRHLPKDLGRYVGYDVFSSSQDEIEP